MLTSARDLGMPGIVFSEQNKYLCNKKISKHTYIFRVLRYLFYLSLAEQIVWLIFYGIFLHGSKIGLNSYLIKLTCLQISSIAFSFLSLKTTLFSSNRLRPSVSIDTISGPNSFTRQCHSVSGIPRSLH